MGRDPWPDLSVQISRRRWRCVPDPLLCLCGDGAAFVHGLSAHAEVWLGPEFLNILDGWTSYESRPRQLLPRATREEAEEIRHALRAWLRLRDEAGPGSGRLFWVRDAVRESCLPPGMTDTVVSRWEVMAQALHERMLVGEPGESERTPSAERAEETSDQIVAAVRDAAALGAVLPGAVLLSLGEAAGPARPPPLCRHLRAWHVPCRRLDPGDDLVALERGLLLRLMIEAGLAGFLWGGLRLAAVHLVAPGHARIRPGPYFLEPSDDGDVLVEEEPRPPRGPWDDARAFWYELPTERPYAIP